MLQNAINELYTSPIASLTGLAGVFALIVGFVLSLRVSNKTSPGTKRSSAKLAPDFRTVLACVFLMPAIAAGFAVVAGAAIRANFLVGIIATLALYAASVSVTSLLAGTMLRRWLARIRHVAPHPILHGIYGDLADQVCYGPITVVQFNRVVGPAIAGTNAGVFVLFLCETIYSIAAEAAQSPADPGEVAMVTLLLLAFGAAFATALFFSWAHFLFSSQAER